MGGDREIPELKLEGKGHHLRSGRAVQNLRGPECISRGEGLLSWGWGSVTFLPMAIPAVTLQEAVAAALPARGPEWSATREIQSG